MRGGKVRKFSRKVIGWRGGHRVTFPWTAHLGVQDMRWEGGGMIRLDHRESHLATDKRNTCPLHHSYPDTSDGKLLPLATKGTLLIECNYL